MRLAQIVFQIPGGKARLPIMLDPFQPAGGEIGGRTQTRHVPEDFKPRLAYLERESRAILSPAADGENLAANFPHMGIPPLDDISRGFKSAAEGIELAIGHGLAPCCRETARRTRSASVAPETRARSR
jgi:hypothetical protein